MLFRSAGVSVGYVYSSLPQTTGTVRLDGLKGPVEIIRDTYGVPHISASNRSDLYFALGYVHAQDRLGQMETIRRLARGRIAEIAGARGVEADRFMRGVDVAGKAKAEFGAVSDEVRTILADYAAGVNAFFKSHGGSLPLDLLLGQVAVEEWLPEDSLLWGKLMALQLSGNWRDESQRARLLARNVPVEILASLWPEWPTDKATTLRQFASLGALPQLEPPPPLGPDRASNE